MPTVQHRRGLASPACSTPRGSEELTYRGPPQRSDTPDPESPGCTPNAVASGCSGLVSAHRSVPRHFRGISGPSVLLLSGYADIRGHTAVPHTHGPHPTPCGPRTAHLDPDSALRTAVWPGKALKPSAFWPEPLSLSPCGAASFGYP